MEQIRTVEIRIDADRMKDTLTVGDLLDLEEGKYSSMFKVIANFVWDKNADAYLEFDAGFAVVRKLSIAEIMDVAQEINITMGAADTDLSQGGMVKTLADTISKTTSDATAATVVNLENAVVPPDSAS